MSFLEDDLPDTMSPPRGYRQTGLAGLGAGKIVLYDPNSQCAKDYDAAVARAKAQGGCVPPVQCQYMPRPGVCFDDPRTKEKVINDIKALEIEAGGLEVMIEMAEAADANSEGAEANVIEEADRLTVDVADLQIMADAARARIADAENARGALAMQRDNLLRTLGLMP